MNYSFNFTKEEAVLIVRRAHMLNLVWKHKELEMVDKVDDLILKMDAEFRKQGLTLDNLVAKGNEDNGKTKKKKRSFKKGR